MTKTPTIALIAPGAMGASLGRLLHNHGVAPLSLLAGRSAATLQRAAEAGMVDATMEQIAQADIVLSVLPPSEALSFAASLAPHVMAAGTRPLYLDCNAVSPDTVRRIEEAIAPAGADFIDASIIGGPASADGRKRPALYASGAHAPRAAVLGELGLDYRPLNGPVGAASALKMVYGGITKGLVGLASGVILGADRAGAAEALRAEMAQSQAALLERFGWQMPDMYSKAWRWAPEMREVAAFLADDPAMAKLFEALGELYDRLGRDQAGARTEIATLDRFLKRQASAG